MENYFIDTSTLSFVMGLIDDKKFNRKKLKKACKEHKICFTSRTIAEFIYRNGIAEFKKAIKEFQESPITIIYPLKYYKNTNFNNFNKKNDKEIEKLIKKTDLESINEDAEQMSKIAYFPIAISYKLFANLLKSDSKIINKVNNLISNQELFYKKTIKKFLTKKLNLLKLTSRYKKDILKKLIILSIKLASKFMSTIVLDLFVEKINLYEASNKLSEFDFELKDTLMKVGNCSKKNIFEIKKECCKSDLLKENYEDSQNYEDFQNYVYENNPLNDLRRELDSNKMGYSKIKDIIYSMKQNKEFSGNNLAYFNKYCVDFYLKKDPGIDVNDFADFYIIEDFLKYNKEIEECLYITLDNNQQKLIKKMNIEVLNKSLCEINKYKT